MQKNSNHIPHRPGPNLCAACFIAIAMLATTATIEAQAAFDLEVTVEGAQEGVGQIILSLFNSRQSHLNEPVQDFLLQIGAGGRAEFVFSALPAGTYSVSAIWDEDGDGELDTGFLGIPSEPVGFSNNPTSRFGPPSFRKSSFELDKNTAINIKLTSID